MRSTQAGQPSFPRRLLRPDALVAIAVAVAFLVAARGLDFGQLTAPGPGLWPTILAVALLVLAVILLVGPDDDAGREPFTRDAWKVLAGAASLGAFILVFSVIGFILPGFVLFLGWLRWFGERSWIIATVISAVGTATLYVVVAIWLDTPFPNDIVAALWEGR